jgi:hypothetical protein
MHPNIVRSTLVLSLTAAVGCTKLTAVGVSDEAEAPLSTSPSAPRVATTPSSRSAPW